MELVLERNLAVMLFLVRDVVADSGNLRGADREDAVAVLPGEVGEGRGCRFEPDGGTSFRLFHDVGCGASAGERGEDMDVVGDAADDDGLAIESGENAAELGVEFGAEIAVVHIRATVLRGEDGVDKNFG